MLSSGALGTLETLAGLRRKPAAAVGNSGILRESSERYKGGVSLSRCM